MLLEFLGELGSGAIRNLARNLFPAFYDRNLSANQALKELQVNGLGYKRADFLADYRANRPGYDLATSVSKIGLDTVPSEGLLKSQYYGTPDRYSFVFKGTGIDRETGEERTQYFTYHRNSLDTRANMQEDAFGWMSEQADTYGFDIEGVTLKEGYVNPIWEGYEEE